LVAAIKASTYFILADSKILAIIAIVIQAFITPEATAMAIAEWALIIDC
jgi:hypothetical protein